MNHCLFTNNLLFLTESKPYSHFFKTCKEYLLLYFTESCIEDNWSVTSPTKMMRSNLSLPSNPKSNSAQKWTGLTASKKSKHEEESPESEELGFDVQRWFQEFGGLLNFTSEGNSFMWQSAKKAIIASALQEKKKTM